MVKKEVRQELKKWNDPKKFLEWKKYEYSGLFQHTRWIGSFALLGVTLIAIEARTEIIKFIGVWLWAILTVTLSVCFLCLLYLINFAQSDARKEIEFLSRIVDGQNK